MKKHVALCAGLFLMSLAGFAQNQLNLVIFSEDGDRFSAYVNGVKQNPQPDVNVKVSGLTSQNISLRIEFEDNTLPPLKQNMMLEFGFEHTAKITRDMKKQLKLRYFGKTPLNDLPPAASTAATGSGYNTAGTDGSNNGSSSYNSSNTTTQTYNSSSTGSPQVSINMGGTGVTMNVNGMDPNGMNTITSTTVTTTNSSSGSTSSNYDATSNANTNSTYQSGGSAAGCSSPISHASFAKMKESVESKSFSQEKMSTARVATKNACLSASQVKEICKLFSLDDDKLAYAKYAYDYTVDKANFYQVSEVFSFSATTDELNKYLEQK